MILDRDLTVLFATAEFGPWVKVGGLGEASTGLVSSLQAMGAEVVVVLPDYGGIELADETRFSLPNLPWWCPEIRARRGRVGDDLDVVLLAFPNSRRPHPYVNPATGTAWPDASDFFFTFSAGVAALAALEGSDLVHLNDWHTATALAHLPNESATVLTVHNLAYQGVDGVRWLRLCGDRSSPFVHNGDFNPLAGGIRLADRVVLVSESYRKEAVQETGGFGLHQLLADRGTDLSGIRNGIDLGLWNPADDPHLPVNYRHDDLSGKEICRKELLRLAGLEAGRGPVIGMVARLVEQKGVDLALDIVPFLRSVSARMVLIGSGCPSLAAQAVAVAERYPDHFVAWCEYDDDLAHLVVAGSDLLLMPSRFEPCGLTQLQAMTCGTIPVVTAVGGLCDTVIDTDSNPRRGTGFVARKPDALAILDALHRACRGWGNPRRRAAVQRRGMTADWSWSKPARRYLKLYRSLAAETG
ncbi:MAG: glycogen synthase [Acidimicrobiia bacterium]|nr:glycogen synthase [Acidimicrobiia bacterium]